MEHFNKLTPAEAERLAILAEECSEVVKTAMKIMRHGYESFDPTGKELGTNRQQLEREIADIEVAFNRMVKNDDIDIGEVWRLGDERPSDRTCTYTTSENDNCWFTHTPNQMGQDQACGLRGLP